MMNYLHITLKTIEKSQFNMWSAHTNARKTARSKSCVTKTKKNINRREQRLQILNIFLAKLRNCKIYDRKSDKRGRRRRISRKERERKKNNLIMMCISRSESTEMWSELYSQMQKKNRELSKRNMTTRTHSLMHTHTLAQIGNKNRSNSEIDVKKGNNERWKERIHMKTLIMLFCLI